MNGQPALLVASIALLLGNAFFVAAEYALVSARRSRIEGLAKKGNRSAKALLAVLQNLAPYVAGIQIAITMIGIGVGAVTEPYITGLLREAFGKSIPDRFEGALSLLSIVLVTLVVVVIGELIPKYLALQRADRVAFLTFRPVGFFVTVLRPLVWLVQIAGATALKPFGINVGEMEDDAIPKEELLLMIRSGGAGGTIEKTHAEMVSRALRLDVLAARDIMVHRVDVKWLDINLTVDETLNRLSSIPFSRIPVCRGDIDEVVGIAYLHDIVKSIRKPNFSLEKLARPVVAIPENLSADRIVQLMRDKKTQILVVMDEYGGTSGLITLEDVVEEVFGELEDSLESERPPIESFPGGRVSARAEVRYDELIARLELPIDPENNTDTLAQIVINALERVPRPGDAVTTNLGLIRVENMARQRITRVSIQLAPELLVVETEDDD